MATEFFGQYDPRKGAVVPASAVDAEIADGLQRDTRYRFVATVTMRRSNRQHNLLFALIEIARENYDGEMSADAVLNVLKLQTGHATPYKLPGGPLVLAPNSVSFAKFPQDAFNTWFPKAVTVLCRDFCCGAKVEAVMAEIERRSGERFKALPSPTREREDA